MKKIIHKARLLLLALIAVSPSVINAQPNPGANPFSQSINASIAVVPLGRTVVSTFELGNNGSDPIPAGGATWNISFPLITTVDQASLNLNGGEGILSPTWTIFDGVTYLTLNVIGAGIPAKIFGGPQTKFTMTVNITGTAIGGPSQQTVNDSYDAAVNQNLNAGDDNANGPFSVVAALPVQIVSFTATKTGSQSFINWTYGNAVNFAWFELDRSADGVHFTDLYKKKYIPDAKSVSGPNFTETDLQPLNGENYYRLKMIDQDGSFMYSKIVKLSFALSEAINVNPNPVTDNARVMGAPAGSTIKLYTLSGNLLQSIKASGSQVDDLAMSSYANGQYVIKVVTASTVSTIKMVKQ